MKKTLDFTQKMWYSIMALKYTHFMKVRTVLPKVQKKCMKTAVFGLDD